MPEVAGDAALLINPFLPAEITNAMIQLTTDQELRKMLIGKGVIRAAKFSWKAMAENMLVIYKEIGSAIH
jgi:glycosyltransferase involved in cell wall biosynthesis